MGNTVIMDSGKTYTVPTTWAKWAIEAVVKWDTCSAAGDEDGWYAFCDTCPWPEDLDEELNQILLEAEFDVVSAC